MERPQARLAVRTLARGDVLIPSLLYFEFGPQAEETPVSLAAPAYAEDLTGTRAPNQPGRVRKRVGVVGPTRGRPLLGRTAVKLLPWEKTHLSAFAFPAQQGFPSTSAS